VVDGVVIVAVYEVMEGVAVVVAVVVVTVVLGGE